MTNAHCHLELSYLKGAIAPHGGFATFAQSIGEKRGLYSDEERLRAIREADLAFYNQGVVAVGDIVNGTTSFATKSASAIRYHSFAEHFSLVNDSFAPLEPALQQPNTSLTAHSIYSVTDKALHEIGAQDESAPLSIHLMESPAESELFNDCGSLHEWYQRAGFKCDFKHYGSPAKRIVGSIPAHRSIMLVHNCMVEQEDIDIIMNHFTAPVYWVLSPRSNHYISQIEPPTELLLSNSLNVCIGTDSLASNHSLDMLEEMRMLKSVPLATRLDWATRRGAEALGYSAELGTIEVGKTPGINLLSGIDYEKMELTENSKIETLVRRR